MPLLQISSDLEMNYLVDDYTDPWRKPETILLLHGNAESGAVWFGWVPHLARHFRVVRPDMRGFGDSTPMPRDYSWTPDGIVDDYLNLMRALCIERVHLVGAKVSGIIARRFAVRYPERVRSLTMVGSLLPINVRDAGITSSKIDEFEKHGLGPWARRTMSGRLGSEFPAEGVEWWIKLMARTAVSTEIGFLASALKWDKTSAFPRITCPTLVITDEGSISSSVDETRACQQKIPRSTLLELPVNSFHVAASHADRCARETFDFISRVQAAVA